jgi:hypothetical protein
MDVPSGVARTTTIGPVLPNLNVRKRMKTRIKAPRPQTLRLGIAISERGRQPDSRGGETARMGEISCNEKAEQ